MKPTISGFIYSMIVRMVDSEDGRSSTAIILRTAEIVKAQGLSIIKEPWSIVHLGAAVIISSYIASVEGWYVIIGAESHII
jgi:hypothetical protein